MKYFVMEPTYKKSIAEETVFKKDIDGGWQSDSQYKNSLWATLEVGWRWGSWLVTIPETEEEIMTFANRRFGGDAQEEPYYKNIQDVYDDYCGGDCEESDEQIIELIDVFTPDTSEACTFHEVSDYDAEMIETWDGCWEDWSIRQFAADDADGYLDEDEMNAYLENVEEAWDEDGYESVENLDFLDVGCEFYINCPITLKPCDENGKVFDEET